MAGLDLSSVAKVVEGLVLLDTVRFTRPGGGQQVFDPNSGQYTYPEGEVVYEGPGAVQVSGTATQVMSRPAANLPWVDETNSKYQVLTPLSAPIAERDMLVSVVQVHAGGDVELIGRQWRVQDPSGVGTLGVVRITAVDQVQQTRETG